jgi:hypothetical protein
MSAAMRRVLLLWLLIAIVTALYWPTALSYSLAWTDFDNRGDTHGYLIAAMCLALIYLRREELTGPMPRARPWAYVALALLGLGWLLAYRAGIQTAHQLLLPVILWMAIYAVCGGRIARLCLFPVGFLYFALPFWEFINGALQGLTVVATHFILHLIGLPVRFYGNLAQIPEGTFAIEGGCSGHCRVLRRVASGHAPAPVAAIGVGGRARVAHQLDPRQRHHYRGPSHRHAKLPRTRQPLWLWLGGVRRGDGGVLSTRLKAAAALGRRGCAGDRTCGGGLSACTRRMGDGICSFGNGARALLGGDARRCG